MLIQLENLISVNPDRIIIVPAEKTPNGDILRFDILTEGFQRITTATAREVDIIHRLCATTEEAKDAAANHPVLRTREWGVVYGHLNYRYAQILRDDWNGGETLQRYLKYAASTAVKTGRQTGETLDMFRHLVHDREFSEYNDKSILTDILAGCLGFKETLQKILDNWDEIFLDLPF